MPFLSKTKLDISTKDLLSWFFDKPQYDLDRPVYVDAANPSRTISGRQGQTIIRQLAAGLRKLGLKKGDCVVVASSNDIYYPIITLGIIAAGGVYTGTNPGYTPFEVAHHINTIRAKFIISEPECLNNILAAKHDVPRPNIFIFDSLGQAIPEGFKSWKSLLEHGEVDWVRFDDYHTASTTNAMLMFSSGTTGLPKAVQLTHYNFIAQHVLTFEGRGARPYETRRLLALPMFHMASTPWSIIAPFRSGTLSHIMRRFELEPFLQFHEKYAITEIAMVPPIVIAVIMSPLSKKYSLKSVRRATSGAAPLGKGPQARFQALLSPGAPFTQVWGMTETSCIATDFPFDEHDTTGSVGRPIPMLDVKLVDDEGQDVSAPDTRGEICVRGPTVVSGYFENPEANARDWDSEGYFHTGDIGYMDGKTGLWYIVDRKKELIKVRGFQVAPPELEAVLLSHPSIIDAAVIGVPAPAADARSGEVPRAYVVRRPGTAALSESDVANFVAEKLAKYKRLDGGVKFLDAIPKTASGKLLKRTLREMATKETRAKL